MRSKLASLALVLILLLASFSTALAQEALFCGDLEEADCALLTTAAVNLQSVSSYQASAIYSVDLSGIPGLPDTSVAVGVDGAFSYGESAQAAMSALAGLQTQEDLTNVLVESPEAIVDLYNGWSFDMEISASLGETLAGVLSADTGYAIPAELSVPLVLQEGVLYVDVTEIAPLLDGMQDLTGWIGFEFGPVLAAAAEQGLLADFAAQADGGAGDAATAGALAGVALLSNPGAFEPFMSIERGEDIDLDGTDAATFVTTLDIASLISSPEFVELVKSLAASGALGEGAPSAADIDQALAMVGMMGPVLFQGLSAESVTAVGIEEPSYVLAQSNSFNWDLAGLLQMAAMSGALPPEMGSTDAAAVDILAEVINSALNEPQEIEAPADALVVPAESMMQQP
ncbi:MAG: hypothetical protein NTV69_01600 [Caldilinea sp.]|jgi:hypothetical protein|nr:hypothetical protein [Caldilinea sp.]